ncbi:hypothetical protein HOH45_02910 [bacterium]|jgi:hypothetical protein|nr:hypothetical protein [bacterium]
MEFKIIKLQKEDLYSNTSSFICKPIHMLNHIKMNQTPPDTKFEHTDIDVIWVYKTENGYQTLTNPFRNNSDINKLDKQLLSIDTETEQLSCIELSGYSFLDCLKFQLQNYSHDLTAVEKIYYISWVFEDFVNNERLSKESLFKEIYPLLNLQAFNHRPEKLQKLTRLSDELLSYCHSKKFSLKQIQLISQIDKKIMDYVLSINTKTPVSASIFIQWVQTINDCLIQYSWTMEKFISHMETEGFDTVQPTSAPETKKDTGFTLDIALFKNELKKLRYKTLYDYNKVIEEKVDDLNLPNDTNIKWDERCETPGFSLTFNVKSKTDLNNCLTSLKDPACQKKLISLLEAI